MMVRIAKNVKYPPFAFKARKKFSLLLVRFVDTFPHHTAR